jgi:phosphate transport system permease protein
VTVVYDMWSTGQPVLTERLWDFLRAPLARNPLEAGLGQAIRGTLELVAIVIVVAIPLGVACGVYLEEYASKSSRFAQFTAVNIRNLAGVPSIVYGILGLAVFVKLLGNDGTGGLTGGRSVISGGLTLAILVLPIVVITTAEALRAVPSGIREGALAVGATRWETTKSFVLPSAAPGILTGTVIALARAAGEAAPLILVGAVTGIYQTGDVTFFEELRGPFTAIPIAIFSWARQPGDDFKALTGAAAIVLLVLIFILNGAAIWLRNRYERKW